MTLTPEVLTIFILNIIFGLLGSIAFILSVRIYLKWDLNATTQTQYSLEKQSFLGATIIKYIFYIKLPLFLFFIFTLDKISNVLTGAMCAAGVVDATEYGIYLFILKIINLYIFAYWLALHAEDIKHEDQPFTKLKFGIFIVAYFLFMGELIVEGIMFSSIDVDKMVSCCGNIYSSSANSYISSIFTIDPMVLVGLFYGSFVTVVLFYILKNRYLFTLSNIIFFIISILTLIAYFSTYIYELPTHHCPFCLLQSDYYYMGYLLYTFLFLGTFYGIMVAFIKSNAKDELKRYKISLLFNFLYVIFLSLYPLVYYVKNGVWL